jgi:serine protease inhibitor
MHSGKLLIVSAIILAVAVAGVGAVLFLFPYIPTQPPLTDDTGSTQEGIQQVVDANNRFAFELYSELNKAEDGNVFYSPYSISAALAMTYEGARGQTADEMKSVFHFPESPVLRPNFAAVYNGLNEGSGDYELRTGNALWVQQDYPFLEDYTSTVENYYGGKAANLDFAGKTEESRQTINSFIEEQTNGKIMDLIPQTPPVLTTETKLVLTNAIYFKGTWKWEFDKSHTRDMDFKITPDNVVKAQMMSMDNANATFHYADVGDLQILELPYKGEKISMLILLPTENLEAIEPYLTAEKLKEWKGQMRETEMDTLGTKNLRIYIPKFEFDTKYFMKDTLSAMGMPTAFADADFSGMDGSHSLYITAVIHQAFVKVDEQGTEAAASTAVLMGKSGARNNFRADHPFIFIIQEKETGNILFMGRVVDPTK